MKGWTVLKVRDKEQGVFNPKGEGAEGLVSFLADGVAFVLLHCWGVR